MAQRDITSKYTTFRDKAFGSKTVRVNDSLLEKRGGFVAASINPLWVDTVEEIKNNFSRIEQDLAKLEKAQEVVTSQANSFSDEKTAKSNEDEVNRMAKRIQSKLRDSEYALKKFSNGLVDSVSEKSVKQNIQRSLAAQLQSLTQRFRSKQRSYMARMTENQSGAGEASAMDLDFTDSQHHASEAIQMESVSRKKEIEKIAKSIEEIATLFNDLNTLVIEQGTLVDRIDYNMQQVVENTQKGVVNLTKAEETQKHTCVPLCAVILIVAIGIMAFFVIKKFA